MTRVGFVRGWTFTRPVRNRGITWIRSYPSFQSAPDLTDVHKAQKSHDILQRCLDRWEALGSGGRSA